MQHLQLYSLINQDSNTVVSQAPKSVYKRLFKRRKQRLTDREFRIIWHVPRVLGNFESYQTRFNIQFSLQNTPQTLGELGTNVFTMNNQIGQMDFLEDRVIIRVSPKPKTEISIERFAMMLNSLQMHEAVQNLQFLIANFEMPHFVEENELTSSEEYASQYPFESYLYRLTPEGSVPVQIAVNSKYLDMLAITREMLYECYKEYSFLPSPLRNGSYIEVWNKVFGAFCRRKQFYEMPILNYNGHKRFIQIEQKQIFFRKDNQCYLLLYWIYHTKSEPSLALKNYEMMLEQSMPKMKQCNYKSF